MNNNLLPIELQWYICNVLGCRCVCCTAHVAVCVQGQVQLLKERNALLSRWWHFPTVHAYCVHHLLLGCDRSCDWVIDTFLIALCCLLSRYQLGRRERKELMDWWEPNHESTYCPEHSAWLSVQPNMLPACLATNYLHWYQFASAAGNLCMIVHACVWPCTCACLWILVHTSSQWPCGCVVGSSELH